MESFIQCRIGHFRQGQKSFLVNQQPFIYIYTIDIFFQNIEFIFCTSSFISTHPFSIFFRLSDRQERYSVLRSTCYARGRSPRHKNDQRLGSSDSQVQLKMVFQDVASGHFRKIFPHFKHQPLLIIRIFYARRDFFLDLQLIVDWTWRKFDSFRS